jgi:hypothetical protein
MMRESELQCVQSHSPLFRRNGNSLRAEEEINYLQSVIADVSIDELYVI